MLLINRVIRISLLIPIIVSFSIIETRAQVLQKMEVELVPEGSGVIYIIRNDEVAVLIVHTTIPELSFECNMGIIKVEHSDLSLYQVHLNPGVNIVTFKADGYQSVKQRFYIERKNYKEVSVEPLVDMEIAKLEVGAGPPLSLEIDGSFIGEINVPANGIITTRLAPGKHQLKLYRTGFQTAIVEISPGEILKVDFNPLDYTQARNDTIIPVKSAPIPLPSPKAKFQRKKSSLSLKAGLTNSNYLIEFGESYGQNGLFFGISYRYPLWKAISLQSGIGYVGESAGYRYQTSNLHFEQIDDWDFIQVPLLIRIDYQLTDRFGFFVSSGFASDFIIQTRTQGEISELNFKYEYTNDDGQERFPAAAAILLVVSAGVSLKPFSMELEINNGNEHSKDLVPEYYNLGGTERDVAYSLHTVKLSFGYDFDLPFSLK